MRLFILTSNEKEVNGGCFPLRVLLALGKASNFANVLHLGTSSLYTTPLSLPTLSCSPPPSLLAKSLAPVTICKLSLQTEVVFDLWDFAALNKRRLYGAPKQGSKSDK